MMHELDIWHESWHRRGLSKQLHRGIPETIYVTIKIQCDHYNIYYLILGQSDKSFDSFVSRMIIYI